MIPFLSRRNKDNADFLANLCMPQVPKFGVANSMLPPRLSPPLPDALQDLTMTEQLLIVRCHPLMRAYRFAGGQYVYRGHVLNLDQDVGVFSVSLPWRANSNDIPILVIEARGGGACEGRYFNTSRVRVENALVWLTANSPADRDVIFNWANPEALPAGSDETFNGQSLLASFFTIQPPLPLPEGGAEEGKDGVATDNDGRRPFQGAGDPFPETVDDVMDQNDAVLPPGTSPASRPPTESSIASDGRGGQTEESALFGKLRQFARDRDDRQENSESLQNMEFSR